MRRLAAVLPVLAALALQGPPPAAAQERAPGVVGVRKVLEKLVEEKKVAGGVLLVARDGKVAALEAVGLQDAEAGTPMKADTIFRICSMTKPVTSAAVMILADDGKLSLDDPLSKFVPEFKERSPISVRQLLTHTSGLTYGFYNKGAVSKRYAELGVSDGLAEAEGTIADHVRKLAQAPLLCEPGTRWEYGLSTDVLGRVVEVASGKSLDAFFQERIFGPLGMKDTHFRLPAEKRGRLATVYRPRAADKAIERLPDGPNALGPSFYSPTYPYSGPGTHFSGGAGLVSTASDYARFLQMLVNGGELDGTRILRKETVGAMTSNQVGELKLAFETHGDRFGFGFGVVSEAAKDKGLGSPGTFSWGGFYHTYFFADPKERLVGVILTQLYPWNHLSMWKDFRQSVYRALQD